MSDRPPDTPPQPKHAPMTAYAAPADAAFGSATTALHVQRLIVVSNYRLMAVMFGYPRSVVFDPADPWAVGLVDRMQRDADAERQSEAEATTRRDWERSSMDRLPDPLDPLTPAP